MIRIELEISTKHVIAGVAILCLYGYVTCIIKKGDIKYV